MPKTITSIFVALAAICAGFDALAAEPTVAPIKHSGAIVGNLKAASECAKGPAQAWLSVGPTLLYQVEVPIGGDFELHTIPGKFNLVVTNANGCITEQVIEVRDGESKKVALNLAPSTKRSPAGGVK